MNTVTAPSSLQTLASGATAGSAKSGTSADFNMFLKLLTAQMQNQDPLSPMDTSQYTQQLVQYSQVEQTLQQTGTLKEILASLTTQNMAQMSGFIGRDAQFASTDSGLAGSSPARWGYTADRAVESVVATVTDAKGKVVDTRTIDGAGVTGRFSWDGKLANGAQAADGSYTLSFKALDSNGAAVPVQISSIGTVKDVISTGGSVSLRANGVVFPASQLLGVSATDD